MSGEPMPPPGSGHPRASLDEDALESHRPSLLRLTKDAEAIISGAQDLPGHVGFNGTLIDGFPSREDVLWWLQAVCVRTLGQIEMRFVSSVGDQFVGVGGPRSQEPVLLSALLDDDTRDSPDIDAAAAEDVRMRIAAEIILPAYHRAFRHLRKDANEYIDDLPSNDSEEHRSLKQRYIAMRPALDEMDAWQTRVLSRALDGLADRAAIIEWTQWIELATHGEMWEGFPRRCFKEDSTVEMLTGDQDRDRRARQAFAAGYLLPMFCLGVRDMSGKAGELPREEQTNQRPDAYSS